MSQSEAADANPIRLAQLSPIRTLLVGARLSVQHMVHPLALAPPQPEVIGVLVSSSSQSP